MQKRKERKKIIERKEGYKERRKGEEETKNGEQARVGNKQADKCGRAGED